MVQPAAEAFALCEVVEACKDPSIKLGFGNVIGVAVAA